MLADYAKSDPPIPQLTNGKVSKNEEFCIEKRESFIKNEDLCIKNEEACI